MEFSKCPKINLNPYILKQFNRFRKTYVFRVEKRVIEYINDLLNKIFLRILFFMIRITQESKHPKTLQKETIDTAIYGLYHDFTFSETRKYLDRKLKHYENSMKQKGTKKTRVSEAKKADICLSPSKIESEMRYYAEPHQMRLGKQTALYMTITLDSLLEELVYIFITKNHGGKKVSVKVDGKDKYCFYVGLLTLEKVQTVIQNNPRFHAFKSLCYAF